MADIGYNTLNYMQQGGALWQINGTLSFGSASVVKYNDIDVTQVFSDYSTGVVTVGTSLAFAAGASINADSGTATLSTNAATLNKMAGVITSESLTTAAGSSVAFVLTNSEVAAGDLAFVTMCGGTNTRKFQVTSAVTSANTITVNVLNVEATNAFNGTFIFNFLVLKA